MSDPYRIARVAGGLLTALLLTVACRSFGEVAGPTDPTRPLRPPAAAAGPATGGTADREQTRPTVQSVLIGPSRRHAVIDGQRMSEGDARQGLEVLEIRADGVVVRIDGSRQTTLPMADARMQKEMR